MPTAPLSGYAEVMLPRRDRRLLVGLTCLTLGLTALVAMGGVPTEALVLAPLVVLVLPLLGGRYVGEDVLARLAAARAPRRRRRASAKAPVGLRASRVLVVRGGRLIAAALAVRPPPVRGVAAA